MNKLEARCVFKTYLQFGYMDHKFDDLVLLPLAPENEMSYSYQDLVPSIPKKEAGRMIPVFSKDDVLHAMRIAAIRKLMDEKIIPPNFLNMSPYNEDVYAVSSFMKSLVDTGNPNYKNVGAGFFHRNGQMRTFNSFHNEFGGNGSSIEINYKDLGFLQQALDQALDEIPQEE